MHWQSHLVRYHPDSREGGWLFGSDLSEENLAVRVAYKRQLLDVKISSMQLNALTVLSQ